MPPQMLRLVIHGLCLPGHTLTGYEVATEVDLNPPIREAPRSGSRDRLPPSKPFLASTAGALRS